MYNKVDQKNICELCSITGRTYFNWKKEKRPIIDFLEKYILNKDVEEFLQYGAISSVELVNNSSLITFEEMKIMTMIYNKIEMIVKDEKLNREGYLIKLYRTLRDLPHDEKDYIDFFEKYNMITFESLKNVIWGSTTKDVVKFYEEYLSKIEIEYILTNKAKFLLPLKAMRKYNAHLDD